MKLLIFVLFLSVVSFAAPPAQTPNWMPNDWYRYLDLRLQEYRGRVRRGDISFQLPRFVVAPMDIPDRQEDAIPTITADYERTDQEYSGPRRLNEVQRLLKDNIVVDALVESSAYLEETLVPNTEHRWSTTVMPLEMPTDSSQTARCLVQTIIFDEPTYSESYKVATLPIGPGARKAILKRLDKDVGSHIQVHELSGNRATDDALIEAMNRYHISIIHEVLANVFPDYVLRRHWNESFIKDLYFKAISRRMTTTYDIIRDQASARLLATVGMDTVNYGAVKYFDKVENRWRLSFGPMSALEDSMLIMNPRSRSSFDFTKWNAPIDGLGIEGDIFLPRPLVEVARLNPLQLDERLERQMLRLLPDHMHPDLSRGVVFYEGRIGEPTKLMVVRRNELRGIAYTNIIAKLTNIFPICRNELFHLYGQAFFTYNPEDIGVALYRRLGYPLSAALPPIAVDSEMWPMQENSPGDLRSNQPQLFALYQSNFESAQRRINRCLDDISKPKKKK